MIKQFFLFVIILTNCALVLAQEEFTGNSIKAGIGIAINDGHWETGTGVLYSLGYQKSYLKNKRLRLNPNMHIGSFTPRFITDVRDQYYRITSLELHAHFDILRYKAISLVLSGGAFTNYSRGLFGSGGMAPDAANKSSEYFHNFYFGGSFGGGFRVNPKKSKFVYEIKPLNFHFGTKYFILGYLEFGLEYKIPLNN